MPTSSHPRRTGARLVVAPTVEELDAALRASGVLSGSRRVASAHAEPIGAGQLAESFRVSLRYTSGRDSPRSVFVKLPPVDPDSAATASRIGAFEREVYFYRALHPALGVRAPGFLGEIERSDGTVGLVLEDLSRVARPLDQLRDGTPAQVRSAAAQLAGLQGPFWDRAHAAGGSHRFYNRTDDHIEGLASRYLASWSAHKQRVADALDARHTAVIEDFGAVIVPWAAGIEGPRTLVHQDLRLDNLLWDGTDAWLVDWQTLGWASPAWDLAFLLGTALDPEQRRSLEEEILDQHLRALRAFGVSGWDHETAWREHRRLSGSALLAMVAALAFVRPTDRGFAMFGSLLRRGAQQAIDHELLAFA